VGCAANPALIRASVPTSVSQVHGSYYQVQRGETLWSIAHDFGWDVQSLAKVNRLPDPRQLKVGQHLFIPAPRESTRFYWPARGSLSHTRRAKGNPTGQGLEIRAPAGSFVRASRTGRVAVAAQQVAGRGRTIVLDHGDGYLTVYCGLEQMLVSPGLEVRQGNPIGRLGQAPLYFEIRLGTRLVDPQRLLP